MSKTSRKFSLKISPVKAIWGGLDGIGRKWGESASGGRRAPNWYTPSTGMFMTPSLTAEILLTLSLCWWIDGGGCSKSFSCQPHIRLFQVELFAAVVVIKAVFIVS